MIFFELIGPERRLICLMWPSTIQPRRQACSVFFFFFFCLCMFARADQFEAHVYTDFNMLYVLTPLCAFMASVKRVLNVFSLGRGVQIHH